MSFANAIDNQSARTKNGMKARVGSANKSVDFFFKAGALRGKDPIPAFTGSYVENPDIALRILQWARDARGGAGERKLFRTVLTHLAKKADDSIVPLMRKIPEIGRYDDLLVLVGTQYENEAFSIIKAGLYDKNGLCAKWMPRKGKVAAKLRAYLGWTPKFYRKTLVGLTKVVETQMCSKEWDEINFSHVPSVAHARYKSAFARNSKTYSEYLNKLESGDKSVKVNASVVYPHDVIKNVINLGSAEQKLVLAQWDALENFVGDASILPMVDTSGSMGCSASGQDNGGITCRDVAVALGLYLADKNKGEFADCFLTFSNKPSLERLKGNVIQKIEQMVCANWDMNTDLHSAFKLILKTAVEGKVSQEEMPSTLLILSDMQFDYCRNYDNSAIEMIRRKYEEAGYNVPNVIFWNLRDAGNVPVKFNETGTALVSGFSPAIVGTILDSFKTGKMLSPENIMMEAIMKERYNL